MPPQGLSPGFFVQNRWKLFTDRACHRGPQWEGTALRKQKWFNILMVLVSLLTLVPQAAWSSAVAPILITGR